MTELHIVILLATGIVVGFSSGLLGVGGGFIMIPVQYLIFLDMGLPADAAIKMAFGTNLLVVLPIAISGAWRHSRMGAVRWKTAVIMGVSGAVAAFAAAALATRLSEEALEIAFGAVVLVGGIRMLIVSSPNLKQEVRDNPWLWFGFAIPIGVVTGFTGLGGGVLAVPVMATVLKFKMHDAVGTSLGTIIFTSLGGVTGYIVNGWNVPDLLPYSIGYIHLMSWLLLMAGSVGMAQVGAMTAHRLPAKQIRYIFMVLMVYIGLRMLGVFDWLGWPI